ncbi:MAG TPA: tyrosine-type recombinase/integrase [Vicinamibacteria bacterium]|nr:tyrosine-type recombinase/integrase [Vicinamibacteria bacterium]
MPVVLLTEYGRGVRPASLPVVPGKRISYHDAALPGFMVRVTPNGIRTFYVWLRLPNKHARLVRIGDIRAVSLADARKTARDILDGARAGVDPREEKRRAQAEAEQEALLPQTVREMAERFLQEGRAKRGRPLAAATLDLYTRSLRNHVYRPLGKLAPGEVRRADVRALIERLRIRYPVQANRTLATLRRLYNWAVEEKEFVQFSPCVGVKVTTEKPRDRVLSNDELRRIVAAAKGTIVEHLVLLILHTAVRSSEARGARWADFDFEERLWTIRGTKTGITHILPLSQGALRVLASIPEEGEFVFPSHYTERSKAGHMGQPKEGVNLLRERSGISDWSLHDLRRTVRTRLPSLGVTPDVAERVLGHTIGGIRRVYDHHDYVPQKMDALEAWSSELGRILHQPLTPPPAMEASAVERSPQLHLGRPMLREGRSPRRTAGPARVAQRPTRLRRAVIRAGSNKLPN